MVKAVHREKLVIIGNGMAGMRTVEELLASAPERYHITVIGAEPHGNYNRIMLSPVLAGEKTFADIVLHHPQWYLDRGITLIAGQTVVDVDRKRRLVKTESGMMVPYDRLVLATGSLPLIIPIKGKEHKDVLSFRGIRDVEVMLKASEEKRRVAVIGGGLLGLEAANGLLKQGRDVTVVNNMPFLLNRQLDKEAADRLQASLEARGMKFLLPVNTTAVESDETGKLLGLRFDDGSLLEADLVIMAVGIVPNAVLAKKIGLQCERAILVSDTMQTFDPRIYAVGECVQHRGALFGLVAPLYEQARVCANHLAGIGIDRFLQKATATTLKISGIDLYSAGDFAANDAESLIYRDPGAGVYKRLLVRGDRLIGAVLFGDTRDGAWYFDLIREKRPLGQVRDSLIFGRA